MAELKKTITLRKGVALAVCTVMGSGLLGLPGLTLQAGSIHSVAGGWLLIALAMVPLIAIFSSLGLRFASSAGLSQYAEAAVGPWGKHAVAVMLCGSFALGIPAMAIIGGSYVQRLFALPPLSLGSLTLAILIASTLLNLMGERLVSTINVASLVVLTAMMVDVVITHFSFFEKGIGIFVETIRAGTDANFGDVRRIAMLLFWAFVGWENLSFSLEEFQRPQRSIPRVYWLSFAVVLVLYFGLMFTCIGAEASGVNVEGASGLSALFSASALGVFQLLVLALVIPANLNAWVFGAARLYYASSRFGMLPAFWGRLTPRGLPLNALLGSLVVYGGVTLLTHACRLPLDVLVLWVNQNGLVLYVLCVAAYWKTERGWLRWPVSLSALLSCAFLLTGFSWWILGSLALMGIGYANFLLSKKRG